MKVPETALSGRVPSGTTAYHRIPLRTFGYLRAILLMWMDGAESVSFRSIVPRVLDFDEIDGVVLGIGSWLVCPILVETSVLGGRGGSYAK